MDIGKVAKDVVKNGLIMFAVGTLLGLAAPPLAQALGASLIGQAAFDHAMSTPVLWTGAFFGAFGAIHAAVAPALSFIFGKSDEKKDVAKETAPAKQPKLVIALAPSPSQQQNVSGVKYTELVDASRVVTEKTTSVAP